MDDGFSNVMTDLQQLVRAANGPDRDLDAEISWRLTPESPLGQSAGLPKWDEHLSGPKVFDGLFPEWREREDIVPPYTGSLDAAIGLAGPLGEAALRHALDQERRTDLPLAAALALGVLTYFLDQI
jgi:hypothetical protein